MAGRRGKGEGSVYRRKDGRWVGQYEVNGKRRYFYGKTREDVAVRLTKWQRGMRGCGSIPRT